MGTTRGLRGCVSFGRTGRRTFDSGAGSAILVFSVSLASLSTAQAAGWELTPGVDVSVGVVNSERDNQEESNETDRILTVSPYVEAARQTRRLNFAARAGFMYRNTDDDQATGFEPEASLGAGLEVIDETLWLNTLGKASQRLVGNNILNDEFTRPQDAVEVYEFTIGPRWQQQFSNTLLASAGYQFGTIHGSGTDIAGSDAHAVDAEVLKSFGNGQWVAALQAEGQRTNYDSSNTASSGALIAGLEYMFDNSLSGRVLLGRDRIEYATDDVDLQSTLYGAGVTWRPLPALYIDAEYQERAYGARPAVTIELLGRVSSLVFDWSRSLGSSRSEGYDASDFFTGITGNNPLQPGGIGAPGSVPTIDSDQGATFATFESEAETVTEVVSLEYQLRGRVSSFTTRLSWSEQRELTDTDVVEATTLEGRLSRRISKSTDLGLNVGFTDGNIASATEDDEDYSNQRVSVNLSVRL